MAFMYLCYIPKTMLKTGLPPQPGGAAFYKSNPDILIFYNLATQSTVCYSLNLLTSPIAAFGILTPFRSIDHFEISPTHLPFY